MKLCHFYRIAQCSSKNSMTLSSFSMTFHDQGAPCTEQSTTETNSLILVFDKIFCINWLATWHWQSNPTNGRWATGMHWKKPKQPHPTKTQNSPRFSLISRQTNNGHSWVLFLQVRKWKRNINNLNSLYRVAQKSDHLFLNLSNVHISHSKQTRIINMNNICCFFFSSTL